MGDVVAGGIGGESRDFTESSDVIDVLVVVLDLNVFEWGRRSLLKKQKIQSEQQRSFITMSQYLNHILVFLNAYLMSKQSRKVAIVGSSYQKSEFLFPQPMKMNTVNTQETQNHEHVLDDKKLEKKKKKRKHQSENAEFVENFLLKETNFQNMQQSILEAVTHFSKNSLMDDSMKEDEPNGQTITSIKNRSTSISTALSLSLCFINRIQRDKPLGSVISPRLLVLQVSPDQSSQYISVMNAIFSAQRMGVTLDACILSGEDSSFMQQAAYITDGVYMKPANQEGFIQYLLSVFMVDKYLRSIMQLPIQSSVDFRASCFETKKPIDIGYVCSVCLSIFQKFNPVCSTCNMKVTFRKRIPSTARQTLVQSTSVITGSKNS